MPTRSKKLDLNQLAKSIVDQATGEVATVQPTKKPPRGKAGGLVSASQKTQDERIDLARLAATARWKKSD